MLHFFLHHWFVVVRLVLLFTYWIFLKVNVFCVLFSFLCLQVYSLQNNMELLISFLCYNFSIIPPFLIILHAANHCLSSLALLHPCSFLFGTICSYSLSFILNSCRLCLLNATSSYLALLVLVWYHSLLFTVIYSYLALIVPTYFYSLLLTMFTFQISQHVHSCSLLLHRLCFFLVWHFPLLLLCANLIGSLKASSFFYDVKFLGVGLLEWTTNTIQGIFFLFLNVVSM